MQDQEGASHVDLVLAVSAFRFVPVIGGHRHQPLLPERLVTFGDGLDQGADVFVHLPDGAAISGGGRAVPVPGLVDPLEVDERRIWALVVEHMAGVAAHLRVGADAAAGEVARDEKRVLPGALLVDAALDHRSETSEQRLPRGRGVGAGPRVGEEDPGQHVGAFRQPVPDELVPPHVVLLVGGARQQV